MVNEIPKINNPENSKSLFELKNDLPVLAKYLESSKAFNFLYGVDMEKATYNPDSKELTFNAVAPEALQGFEGIMHGAYSVGLMDSVTGAVALIESSKNDKRVVTFQMDALKYKKALKVGEVYVCKAKVVSGSERFYRF